MEIDQDGLRTLSAVLREGTFEAAAIALHVTPSAVSQRIKALELAVGRVVVRRTKPIEATRDGEILVRLAKQWELLATEASAELVGARPTSDDDGDRDLPRIPLPIAANADSLATWLLPVLAEFHREHAVAVEVIRDDESRTSEYLRSGHAVAALTSVPTKVRGYQTLPLGAVRYHPVATPEYLARWMPDGPTERALARAPMVQFDRSDRLQREVLGLLTDAVADPPTVYIPASTEYHRAIEHGIGWGAAPHVQIADALAAGRLVRFTNRSLDVGLYWQTPKLHSPLVSALTELIAAAAQQHLRPR